MIAPGPLLSVVIVCRNQLNALKFTLITLRDQPPAQAHEVIVVDQGSTDGTAQFLSGLADNPHLRLVSDDANEGRTAARNRGARASRGRYLMFMDPGVVVGPHWSVPLLETMERDPLVGAVAGKVILQDGRIDHAGLALLKWDAPRRTRLSGRSLHAGRPADSRNGSNGRKAPPAKARNEELAAPHGDPNSSGFRPSSSRASVLRPVSGSDSMRVACAWACPLRS